MNPRYPYVYHWSNNPARALLKGRRCRIIATFSRNTVVIEFPDGHRASTSRRALRKATTR